MKGCFFIWLCFIFIMAVYKAPRTNDFLSITEGKLFAEHSWLQRAQRVRQGTFWADIWGWGTAEFQSGGIGTVVVGNLYLDKAVQYSSTWETPECIKSCWWTIRNWRSGR
jgi:hypothetical protein